MRIEGEISLSNTIYKLATDENINILVKMILYKQTFISALCYGQRVLGAARLNLGPSAHKSEMADDGRTFLLVGTFGLTSC